MSAASPPLALALYWALPFVAMLLAIAVCPLLAPGWWEPNRNKLLVSCILGLPVVALYVAREPLALVRAGQEYLSFVLLLASLYVISGGIQLSGDLRATPLTNTGFLALGSVLASVIGTTGASMLLIRPVLQTNQERRRVRHTVVFFIFLVSNIGGLLTPLGDPPLFLGYLQGVPFAWTLSKLALPWLVIVTILLASYLAWDTWHYRRESPEARERDRVRVEPLRLRGAGNGILLAGVVLAVVALEAPARELVIVALAALSLRWTPVEIRRANGSRAYPMLEVATLFLGVFLTMIPALALLRTHAATLGVRAPWQFFWATGLMSSFLDNAPTYLTFLALGRGLPLVREVAGVSHEVLLGISLGATCMGANTYIGNAPNFMVRSIAESAGVQMPNFFEYMAYSGAILLPLFAAVTLLFF